MLLDKFEELLEGILEGLKARKNIQPLQDEVKKLSAEVSNLQRELNAANTTVKNLRDDVENYSVKIKNFSAERKDFERQLENQRVELQRKVDAALNKNSILQENLNAANATANSYRETYSQLEEIYKLYLTLDDDARYNLSGIFGAGNTATEFLSGAVQESHIHSLWDYIARHNSDTLQKIFDFAFDMFNKGFRDAPYSRLTISQGDYYDDEFMNRTPSSPQMGNVSRVLFQGYKYSTGNVIKKSIVELG